MTWIAACFVFLAMSACWSMTPEKLPAKLVGFYWLASWLGQSFALPLSALTLGAAILLSPLSALVLAAASALFGIAHLRNRKAGRLLLEASGLPGLRIPLLAGALPYPAQPRTVRRRRNLSYGPAGKRNLLDLVEPTLQQNHPMPILIHVHGGAWVTGAKGQQGRVLMHHLAAAGWLCADINYRLGPRHRCPEMVSDVLRAIAWLRENASGYGGDPHRIFITGGSAGGHLAALAALVHDDPTFKPGFETADCHVSACVPLYGRYDFLDRKRRLGSNHHSVIDGFMAEKVMPGSPAACPEIWHSVSPIDRIRPDAPPMWIVHGDADSMLPHQDAQDFATDLAAVSRNRTVYIELQYIQHAWDMFSSALAWAQARAVENILRNIAPSPP